jgi:hypothetical protein
VDGFDQDEPEKTSKLDHFDSVVGGGKIRRQAETIGWPCVLPVESVTD